LKKSPLNHEMDLLYFKLNESNRDQKIEYLPRYVVLTIKSLTDQRSKNPFPLILGCFFFFSFFFFSFFFLLIYDEDGYVIKKIIRLLITILTK
jgi:hypothetical protein